MKIISITSRQTVTQRVIVVGGHLQWATRINCWPQSREGSSWEQEETFKSLRIQIMHDIIMCKHIGLQMVGYFGRVFPQFECRSFMFTIDSWASKYTTPLHLQRRRASLRCSDVLSRCSQICWGSCQAGLRFLHILTRGHRAPVVPQATFNLLNNLLGAGAATLDHAGQG